MAGEYRGALKVAGSTLKGWLVDTRRPTRRVRFNLIIDNEFRGTFVANRRRLSFARKRKETIEDTHGFSIPIRRAWISGKQQTIRLEDPSSVALDLSLTASLGPAPNENFEDHIVSSQAVLGGRGRMQLVRAEEQPEEGHEAETRQSTPIRQLLKKIEALSDADLASLVIAVERDILADRIGRYERADDWQSASAFRRLFLGAPFENLLVAFGRSALKGHNPAAAGRVLTAAAALFPQSFEANYQAGVAMSLQGQLDKALHFLKAADLLEEGDVRAKHEMVGLFGKMIRNPMSPEQRARMRAEHLELLGALVSSENAGVRARYRVPFATALYAAGRYDEAIATADSVLAAAPNDVRALVIRAKLFVARNEVAEGRATYEHILGLDRDNAAARLGLKALSGLVAPSKPGQHEGIAGCWVCTDEIEEVTPEIRRALERKSREEPGYVQITTQDGKKLDFWRSEVLKDLRESGVIQNEKDIERLMRWKDAYGMRRPAASTHLVAVIYHAAERGSERVATNAAAYHAREGGEAIIVVLNADFPVQETTGNGVRRVLLGETAADVRSFLLENDISLVHAISCAAIAVAEAIRFTNIAFVCGVHFEDTLPSAPDAISSGEAMYSRQELLSILERAGTVYAGSRVAQKILENDLGVRCSVISSVPRS